MANTSNPDKAQVRFDCNGHATGKRLLSGADPGPGKYNPSSNEKSQRLDRGLKSNYCRSTAL